MIQNITIGRLGRQEISRRLHGVLIAVTILRPLFQDRQLCGLASTSTHARTSRVEASSNGSTSHLQQSKQGIATVTVGGALARKHSCLKQKLTAAPSIVDVRRMRVLVRFAWFGLPTLARASVLRCRRTAMELDWRRRTRIHCDMWRSAECRRSCFFFGKLWKRLITSCFGIK